MSKIKENAKFFKIYPEDESVQSGLNIFNALKEKKTLSLSGLGERSGMSLDSVTGYVTSYVEKGVLKRTGAPDEGLIEFNASGKKVLGIGFTDDACNLTVMNLAGNIIAKEKIAVKPFSELKGTNKEMKEMIEKISKGTNLRAEELYFAGVAVPERVKEENINILAGGISRLFGCGVFMAKEATAAGYGEKDFGKKTLGKDILYMYSDIGIGTVVKGEMIFEAEGETEEKGKKYLHPWNQFSIAQTAKSLVDKGLGTDIVEAVGGNVNKITLDIVLDAAAKKDKLAEELVKRSALALGVRVSYLANMFNTEVIVLGGGTEKKEGMFIDFVKESTRKFLLKDLADKVDIIPAEMGKDVSSIGAASLCRRELFMEV